METCICQELIGQEIQTDQKWVIIAPNREAEGYHICQDIGSSPDEVKTKIFKRTQTDWETFYNLGFRIVKIQNTAKIISVLIENNNA